MFNNKTLKQRIIIFTIIIISIIFVFFNLIVKSAEHIDDSIHMYKEKAVKSKILILSIEKDLNYISRTSSDIMFGNNYENNIGKIKNKIISIKNNFIILKSHIKKYLNNDEELESIQDAEKTTLQFIYGVDKQMKALHDSNNVEKVEAYGNYKKKLTPLAVQSRNYFGFIKNNINQEFHTYGNKLKEDLIKQKNIIELYTFLLSILVIGIMTKIYFNLKEHAKAKNDLEILNKILSKYVIYSKTDLKGKIIEASDAFSKISEYSRDELVGKPHNIIRHPDMPSASFKNMWDTIKSGEVWSGEVKNLKKGGDYYWVTADINPTFDSNGNITEYMAIRQDITSKKDFEHQHDKILESEKMASLGDLIGNIAHQWRQPLSVISTAASGVHAKYDYGILDEKDIPNYMNKIIENTDYLSKTIETFTNFVKKEKAFTKIILQDEIAQSISILSGTLKDNNITTKDNIDYNNKIVTMMNTGELPHVIINILNNAKDILIENKIKNGYIELNLTQKDDNAIISIEDNAGGIPKDIIDKIFEPYFTTKHQSIGTGLGLHMSYKIITENLKGKLYVKNTGNGAKFFIEIPIISESIHQKINNIKNLKEVAK